MSPCDITATRSAMASASDWSCVTKIVVIFRSSWSWRISARTSTRMWASRFDSGSSSSRTDRRLTMRAGERDTLALAARKLVRTAVEQLAHPHEPGDLVDLALGLLAVLLAPRRAGKRMFSRTVMCG